jgi:EmrB/QacA subfamily drug resistance transporter
MSAASPAAPAAFHELSPRAVVMTMVGVMAAMLMSALDQTIVGTAMPRVIAELHGFEHYTGVLTAYMVASTTAVPIAGKLSDLYGRKRFLLLGVGLFVFASALCGASRSMAQLIGFRGLQGLGAGVVQAMAFTTIADLFPPSKRGRISGAMGATFGLASVVGPALGGFLTDGPGWRYVFYVNLPVGAIAAGILVFFFPDIRIARGQKPNIDYLGAASLVLSIVPLLLALSWGGRDYPWSSPIVIGLLALGVTMAAAFLVVERRAVEPIIPLSLFANRVVATSAAGAALVAMGMFGTVVFIPLFVQAVIGASATRSGAVMMPMTFALILSSVVTGQLITRLGRYRIFAILGAGTTGAGLFLLSQMDAGTGLRTVVRNMILMGLGLGATMPVFTLAVQNAVSVRTVGVATSTIQFLRSVGGALGAAVFGSVLANRYANAFHTALPPSVASELPAALVARFDNPQILMNPEAAHQTKVGFAALGERGEALLPAVHQAVREGLSASLHDVYLVASGLLVLATVILLFLRDLPLRTTNRPDDVAPAMPD